MTSQEVYAELGMTDSNRHVFHPRRVLWEVLGRPEAVEIIEDTTNSYHMGWRRRSRDAIKAEFVCAENDRLWLMGEIEWRDGEEWIVDGKLTRYPLPDWKPRPGELTEAGKREVERRGLI